MASWKDELIKFESGAQIAACCAFWPIGKAEFVIIAKWSSVSGCISSVGTSDSAQLSSLEECNPPPPRVLYKHEDTPRDLVFAPVSELTALPARAHVMDFFLLEVC
jgi:hypothetical protein